MKKVLLLAILAMVGFSSYAQKEVSDTLDFNRVKEEGYIKGYKNNHQFLAMKMEDGSYINVNDEISLGKPNGTNTIAQKNVGLFNGSVSTVSAFNNVIIGRMGLSVMNGMQYLPSNFSGKKVKIKEIKKGWTIFEFVDGGSTGTIMNPMEAFANGEAINPNRAMTRAEAIAKLKESKDLLDLGMIKQSEYDELKSKLALIIAKS